MRFEAKTVIITGASSGIGLATAQLMIAEGANVVVNGRDVDRLKEAFADLPAARVLKCPGDASDPTTCGSLVTEAVERFGGVDVVVANTGGAVFGDIEAIDYDTFSAVMNLNAGASFLPARAAMPELRKTRGAIVMTASVAGLGGDWGMVAYNAAKGAVVNMVRAMALDAGRHGVRVNAVAPSLTATTMTAEMLDDPVLTRRFVDRIPLGRVAKPDDIALPILFLASDDARFVTGVVLPVDGGLSASSGQPRVTGVD